MNIGSMMDTHAAAILFSLSGGGITLRLTQPLKATERLLFVLVLEGFCLIFRFDPLFGDRASLSASCVFSVLLCGCYAPVLMYVITRSAAAFIYLCRSNDHLSVSTCCTKCKKKT